MADKPKDEEIKESEELKPSEPAPSQPPEEKPEEPQEEVPEENIEEEPVEEPEDKPPSRRESLRIQQLLEKLKQQPQTPAVDKPGGMDYKTAIDADPEVIKQLEDDRQAVAQAQYNSGLEQAKSIQFHTRLEIDAPRVEAKFPQLDKESADFKPVVANAINQWYLNTVGYDPKTDTVVNPTVRYADFVDGIFELADEVSGEKTASTSKNIAKQAANTAIRPGGGRTKGLDLNKAPEQMSDEELKAVIAQAGI